MTSDTDNTHTVGSRLGRRQFVIGAAVAGILLVAAIVMWPSTPDAPTASPPATPAPDMVSALEATNASPPVAPRAMETSLEPLGEDFWFWRDMLESTECEMKSGSGPASNTAAVVAPTEGGAAFRVVDDTGVLFEGKLPFKPSRTWLGRHRDGRVLAGFSYLRLNSGVRRPPSSPEPVVVYQDGEKIYETDKAWSFGIVPDGTAFFTVEPESDNTSDLIIRDIDGAMVRSHDLEYLFTTYYDEPPFLAWFTNDGDEVTLVPGYFGEDQFFYPVDGGKSRAVRYQGRDGLMGGVFASSETGFYVYNQGEGEPMLVVRRDFDWDAPTDRMSEAWATEVDLLYYVPDTTHLSSDNRYLLLQAWNTHLLDAETGRILFAHPAQENFVRTQGDNIPKFEKLDAATLAYRKADRERLASVVDADEVRDQDSGAIGHYSFRNGNLYISRKIGGREIGQCYTEHRKDRDAVRACVERVQASGGPRDVLDLYDLANIQIDSQPDRRIVVDRSEYECRPGPNSGLVSTGSMLRYIGRED